MTVDRKRLRELALAATPGPWRFSPWHVEEGPAAVRKDDYGYISSGFASDATAKYVAAANPQTILELLDALEAAEQPTERSEDARNNEREACARIAESKFARIHTFASENSDRYIAMRDAGDAIADEIRRRAAEQGEAK